MKTCAAWDRIYVTAGSHPIKYLEALNSQGSITGVFNSTENISNDSEKLKELLGGLNEHKHAIISSEEDDSTLMSFNGNFILENVTLDCRKVRLGLHCRFGTITLRNCMIIGDKSSTTAVGIVVNNEATCVLDNSIVKNVATAINCMKGGKVVLKKSTITDCSNSLDINDESVIVSESSKIKCNSDAGIIFTGNNLIMSTESNKAIFNSLDEFKSFLR